MISRFVSSQKKTFAYSDTRFVRSLLEVVIQEEPIAHGAFSTMVTFVLNPYIGSGMSSKQSSMLFIILFSSFFFLLCLEMVCFLFFFRARKFFNFINMTRSLVFAHMASSLILLILFPVVPTFSNKDFQRTALIEGLL